MLITSLHLRDSAIPLAPFFEEDKGYYEFKASLQWEVGSLTEQKIQHFLDAINIVVLNSGQTNDRFATEITQLQSIAQETLRLIGQLASTIALRLKHIEMECAYMPMEPDRIETLNQQKRDLQSIQKSLLTDFRFYKLLEQDLHRKEPLSAAFFQYAYIEAYSYGKAHHQNLKVPSLKLIDSLGDLYTQALKEREVTKLARNFDQHYQFFLQRYIEFHGERIALYQNLIKQLAQ